MRMYDNPLLDIIAAPRDLHESALLLTSNQLLLSAADEYAGRAFVFSPERRPRRRSENRVNTQRPSNRGAGALPKDGGAEGPVRERSRTEREKSGRAPPKK